MQINDVDDILPTNFLIFASMLYDIELSNRWRQLCVQSLVDIDGSLLCPEATKTALSPIVLLEFSHELPP